MVAKFIKIFLTFFPIFLVKDFCFFSTIFFKGICFNFPERLSFFKSAVSLSWSGIGDQKIPGGNELRILNSASCTLQIFGTAHSLNYEYIYKYIRSPFQQFKLKLQNENSDFWLNPKDGNFLINSKGWRFFRGLISRISRISI